jgi:hypothetical protein
MSSLAFSAATFEEEPKTQSVVQRRKNKTHKNMNNMTDKSYYSEKVNNVLSKIHNKIHNDNGDDYDDSYENFEPISPPTPMKVPKKETEGYSNFGDNTTSDVISQMQTTPHYKVSANSSDTSPHDPQYPYYPYPDMVETMNRFKTNERMDTFPPVDQSPPYVTSYDNNTNKLLMEKLNYMIHLLEETHDEQTNNVLEEVILYSFLGIFIIFLIDNFIKVGRYVR